MILVSIDWNLQTPNTLTESTVNYKGCLMPKLVQFQLRRYQALFAYKTNLFLFNKMADYTSLLQGTLNIENSQFLVHSLLDNKYYFKNCFERPLRKTGTYPVYSTFIKYQNCGKQGGFDCQSI